jgi:uncharacterized protein
MSGLPFTVAVTLVSRALVLRDRVLGRLRGLETGSGVQVSRHAIASGARVLDSVFVTPALRPRAALLICHGIGEVVDHWLRAQELLAAHGVASLVFDYAGYGRSGGRVDWRACEDDAVEAFQFLEALVPEVPVSILGFSMGSGIAVAVLHRIRPAGLILGSAFTSFGDAACVLGLPRIMARPFAGIWRTRESLPDCQVPILILHCECDRAFPVRMARELAAGCGAKADLVIVPSQAHNEAFYSPKLSYWSHVLSRLTPGS